MEKIVFQKIQSYPILPLRPSSPYSLPLQIMLAVALSHQVPGVQRKAGYFPPLGQCFLRPIFSLFLLNHMHSFAGRHE
jgi:hypothetical protein